VARSSPIPASRLPALMSWRFCGVGTLPTVATFTPADFLAVDKPWAMSIVENAATLVLGWDWRSVTIVFGAEEPIVATPMGTFRTGHFGHSWFISVLNALYIDSVKLNSGTL